MIPNVNLFFFNDTATTEIYTLSLHDALPISDSKDLTWYHGPADWHLRDLPDSLRNFITTVSGSLFSRRSEEHTSELQSRQYLVCRLLLEKKKTNHIAELYLIPSAYVLVPPSV